MLRSLNSRIIASFAAVAVAVVVLSSIVAFAFVQYYERAVSNDMGYAAARACADMISIAADSEEDFIPGSPDYDDCKDILSSLCVSEEMTYLYAYTYDEKTHDMTYIMVVAADEKHNTLIQQERPYGTTLRLSEEEVQSGAFIGKSGETAIEFDNELGHMLDWVVPVKDQNNMYAGSSYSISGQRWRIFNSSARIVVTVVVVLLVLLIIQLFILRKHVLRPLTSITGRIKSFSVDSAHNFDPIEINSEDEIGEIARAFEKMADKIASDMDDIEEMTTEKAQATTELDIARRIQQGVVPEHSALTVKVIEVYAFSHPARKIGGDFYDIVERDDGKIAAVIGDVSGKGIAAALFMVMGRTMIRDGLYNEDSPAKVLREVNDKLCDANPEGMFVTVMIAVFDPSTGNVVLANAGHMPPMRIGARSEYLDVDTGVLMGLFEDADIVDEEVALLPGEALVLYTDGVTEAVNPENKFFGKEGALEAIGACYPQKSAEEIGKALLAAVNDFVGEREQFDDVTAVIIANKPCKPRDEESSMKELKVAQASFRAVREDIMAVDGEKAAKMKACLAVEEAFTNIVSYSGASRIWYSVEENDSGQLQITLADDGIPFDPFAEAPLHKEFEELDDGGMGIGLIRQIAESAEYKRDGSDNVLLLRFALS